MYRKIEDFLNDWKAEAAITQKLLSGLTDETLSEPLREDGRTLGRLAWHIVESPAKVLPAMGLPFSEPAELGGDRKRAANLADACAAVSAAGSAALPGPLQDEDLPEKIEIFGSTMARGDILRFTLTHQTHHRGQLHLRMRQLGLAVVGVCGPTSDEWRAMGQEPHP